MDAKAADTAALQPSVIVPRLPQLPFQSVSPVSSPCSAVSAKPQRVGLKNRSTECFLNAVIQLLAHLLDLPIAADLATLLRTHQSTCPLLNALVMLIADMKAGVVGDSHQNFVALLETTLKDRNSKSVVAQAARAAASTASGGTADSSAISFMETTTPAYPHVNFSTRDMQDCTEFLLSIIDVIGQELNAVHKADSCIFQQEISCGVSYSVTCTATSVSQQRETLIFLKHVSYIAYLIHNILQNSSHTPYTTPHTHTYITHYTHTTQTSTQPPHTHMTNSTPT